MKKTYYKVYIDIFTEEYQYDLSEEEFHKLFEQMDNSLRFTAIQTIEHKVHIINLDNVASISYEKVEKGEE